MGAQVYETVHESDLIGVCGPLLVAVAHEGYPSTCVHAWK